MKMKRPLRVQILNHFANLSHKITISVPQIPTSPNSQIDQIQRLGFKDTLIFGIPGEPAVKAPPIPKFVQLRRT